MRRTCLILACLSAWLAGCAPQFLPAQYLAHVAYLASDDLGGRAPGTPGIDLAAEYIAHQFATAGVQPGGEKGTYFQSFELTVGREMREPRFTVDGVDQTPAAATDYTYFPFTASDEFDGPVAFIGYGITSAAHDYDDYTGFDVRDKVLLMFRYEPHAEDPKAEFGGERPSPHAAFRAKAGVAKSHGAKAILIVNPPLHHGTEDQLYPSDRDNLPGDYGLPMLHVTRSFANRLLKAGGAEDLATLQKAIDTAKKPRSVDLRGLSARGTADIVPRQVTARNVLGLIPGEGPDRDEYVVIGAHYDHLGRVLPRRQAGDTPAEPQIHNGADDNASGTAGLIEVARALGPRGSNGRSILLMAYSAEERGLLGSVYYVDHPTVPLENVVAMLNMDMIGRLRANRLDVYGVDTARHMRPLIEYHGNLLGFRLHKISGSAGPSDHMSFANKQIPALHFFTGMHPEYHMPGDDTPTINSEGGARVANFVYSVTEALARAPRRPTFVAVGEGEQKRPARPSLQVRLGVMPSYADDNQKGLLIEGITPGSPAEKAKIQQGDRIVRVDKQEVNDVFGLVGALSKRKPGDAVRITLLRKTKRMTVTAKLDAAE